MRWLSIKNRLLDKNMIIASKTTRKFLTVLICVRNHNPSVCVVAAVFQRRGGNEVPPRRVIDGRQGPGAVRGPWHKTTTRVRVAHLEFVRDGGPMHLIE